MPNAPSAINLSRGALLACPAECALIIDGIVAADAWRDLSPEDDLLCLIPRRVACTFAPPRSDYRMVAASATLGAARQLAMSLLTVAADASAAQLIIAGRAVAEFLSLALTPHQGKIGRLLRREASLSDRISTYVDLHLGEDLDVAALCKGLSVSRSAMYRAMTPFGGISAFVSQRRLAAVHQRLLDPAETRGVAEIARAHGIGDASGFSRNFKKRYGVTAAEMRRGRSHSTSSRASA